MSLAVNTLYYGDCLEWLPQFPSEERDFMGVIERERAAIGVYTTVEPIRAGGAQAEASRRGHLKLGASEYPRAQLWSIQDYFDHRFPALPALADPYTGKPLQGSLQMSLA